MKINNMEETNNNGKITSLEAEIKEYLLNKIRPFFFEGADLSKWDINTLFMISSYKCSKEQINEIINYIFGIIGRFKKCNIVWTYDDSSYQASFNYLDDCDSYLLTTRENYNSYEVINLVYNKLDGMKLERELTK